MGTTRRRTIAAAGLVVAAVVSGCLSASTVTYRAAALHIGAPGMTAVAREADRRTVHPRADTFVTAALPRARHGRARTLRYGPPHRARAYLKFAVPRTDRPIVGARLVLTTRTRATRRTRVFATSPRWRENRLTWRTAPDAGERIDSVGRARAGRRLVLDVTDAVRGEGTYGFVLTSRSATVVASSNARRHTPRLRLTLGDVQPASVVVAFAGDIACDPADPAFNGGEGTADACRARHTADLIAPLAPSYVFALGDLQYNMGRLDQFAASYDGSWGRFKAITRPAVGNHDYGTIGASGYFDYFGAAAGPRGLGYYSFDIAVGTSSWHVAVINAECQRIDGGVGCAVGSPQYQWLAADLQSSPATCTAVLTHEPRWSSSSFYTADIQPLVELMDQHRVDLLLAGHAHSYERFAPQTSTGQPSSTGIRQITVGTGGKDSQGFAAIAPNSVVRRNHVFGVEKLTLHEGGYDWEFVPDPTTPFADAGSGSCS